MLEALRAWCATPQGEISYRLYVVLFLLTGGLTYGLTHVMIWLAPRLGAVDKPDARRIHQRPVPKLGGLALFVAIAAGLVVAAALHPWVARVVLTPQSLAIFVGMAIMLAVGVYDDLFGVSWMWKFAFQIVAACIVIRHGMVIMKLTNPLGAEHIQLNPLLAFVFTLVWLIGITNAVNLSDGLDGLATGIVLIVSGVTFANSLHLMVMRPEQTEAYFVFPAVTSICVAAASLAFLRFNFYPARIFLGDTGSLFLGFWLACTAVRSSQISTTTVALLVPVIALGLPILDTVIAFLRRAARRRNPFQADLEHIHHKMLESGLSHPETVLVLYGFCLLLGIAALVVAYKRHQYAGVILFVLTAIVLVGFRKFGILDITRLWGIRGNRDDQREPPSRRIRRREQRR
ncbi:MAG: undecaprenyl/decaprenyl-phosphate alpha-N-acetylglucosaminyl 1-phosphate transferase [bacterium]|nr:undecaprenyl/decaprenyl-phosphate alpha-N-acetylglucosaminyl 1-phosphate transferase [bacterium]